MPKPQKVNTVRGTGKDDILIGTNEDDRILGGNGNDILNGLAGNDTLDGGKGSDVYIGQEGNDTFVGGGFADQDTADYSSETGGQGIIVNQSGNQVQASLPPDTVIDTYGDTDSIVNVPNLIGSQY